MRIIKIEGEGVILVKEMDPINSLETVFGLSDLAHMKKRVNQFLESSFSIFPHKTFKKEPSYTLFLAKLIRDVVVSLYVLEERKEEYNIASLGFTEEFLNTIYTKTKIKNEVPWEAYPSSLSAKEVNRPFKLLSKIKEQLALDDWFDFLDLCTQNCLGFGFQPEWEGFQEQGICFYYLPKLIDLGFLFYYLKTEMGRKALNDSQEY